MFKLSDKFNNAGNNEADGWNSLDDFFSCLNGNVSYVVLRNFETLDHDVVSINHPDIDFLCLEREKFLSVSRSFPRGRPNDSVHRFVFISKKKINVDVRCVGDGYYDSNWAKDILKNRILYNDRFFVPSNIDYFYSLLYHVLIQKKIVSEDYIKRLGGMAQAINIPSSSVINLSTLQAYMHKNHYYFTYPESPYTIANFENVDKELIKRDTWRVFKRNIIALRINIIHHITTLLWAKK